MADFPTIDLQSQLIARGLSPTDPTMTYIDFATQLAKNRQDQAQMEQNLARAKELTAQSQLETRQKIAAEAAGYNPELINTMTKDAAKKYLMTVIEAKKVKVAPETIDNWYESLPALVSRQDVENFANTLIKTPGGMSIFSFTKDTMTKPDEHGVDRIYNVAIRRIDGKRTDKFDPESGEPVFPDAVDLATTPEEKAEAQDKLERAKPQLAGAEARFATSRSQFAERSWQKLQDKINVSNAPYARAIGQASVNNMRADRALTLINREGELTKNEYDIIVSDLAAIFKGGVPDIISLEHQRYESLKSRYNEILQYIMSKPEEIDTPEIKARLKAITLEVKEVDNDIILNYMDSVAAGYEPFIQSDPARFARMINAQLRNMKKPEVDVSVIEDMDEKPLGAKEVKEPKKSKEAPEKRVKPSENDRLGLGPLPKGKK